MKKSVETEYSKGLIYSKPGVGKTVAMTQLEVHAKKRGCKLLYIDLEGGLKKRLEIQHPMMSVMRPEKFIEFNDVYNKLDGHLKDIASIRAAVNAKDVAKVEMLSRKLLTAEAWFSDTTNPEKWYNYIHVVIDSFSETQSSAMDHIVPNTGFIDIKNPEIQHWGKNINMVMFMTKAFRDLPINTWFTAHVLDKKDENDAVIETVPKFSGKNTPEVICAMLDLVIYYSTLNAGPVSKRVMYFQPLGKASKTVAKDRFDILGNSINDPDMAVIFEKLGLDCVQPVITFEEVTEFLNSAKK